MSLVDLVAKFSLAVAHAEGYGIMGAIPTRANNPGDLANGDVGCGFIESKGDGAARITIYPTAEAGWDALAHKLTNIFTGQSEVYPLSMTILELAMKWSGSPAWAENVSRLMGYDVDTKLADLVEEFK